MSRIGMNPARHRRSDYTPARVTVAMLTHIPSFSGYFRQRFDVLRLSLGSVLAHTGPAYDLLVFDNGSCAEVVDYLRGLRDVGQIRYLMLASENIGKIGAFQLLFRAAPGEVIAYSDDDVFYLPGWLEAHLEILDAFPEVGMVSGTPIRIRFRDETASNRTFAARPDVQARRGRFIPEEWEREYVANTGREWDAYQADTAGMEDLVLAYNGVEAFAAANHFQFVTPRRVILEALPVEWGGQLMGQMVEIDRAVDQAGLLRLSTRQRMVRMMGNVVTDDLRSLAESLDITLQAARREVPPAPSRSAGPGWLRRTPGVMRLARALYDRLYWFIHTS
jgi:hypothetical protein